MIREQVLIQTINVSRRYQQVFFQLKLPRDTHRIIGVETGLYILDANPYFFTPTKNDMGLIRSNTMMGTLQLQSNGNTDVFYSKEIFERDINTGRAELKQFVSQGGPEAPIAFLLVNNPPDGNDFDFFNSWTHGSKREEDPVSVCNCSVINGWFKDAAAAIINTDIHYQVMLYIWIERKINL